MARLVREPDDIGTGGERDLLDQQIIDIDGRTFEDLEDVHEELRRKGAGQEVQAKVIRGGQNIQMTIRIGERPVG